MFAFKLPSLAYRKAPPADVGMTDVIFPFGERPQTSLFGIGGYATQGELAPIAGGALVGYQTVQAGLPQIVPTPGAGQWLEQR
jgi:hypothetical protein